VSRYSSSFASIFKSFVQRLPIIGHVFIILGYSLDLLAFGSNANNSKFSQIAAFISYSVLMILSTIVFFNPAFTAAAVISSLGIVISMYFEGVTILAWFDNYKNLEWQKLNNEPTLDIDHENAKIMLNAATITFISMFLKGIALSISTIYPAAALGIIVTAQIAECAAMIGTLGKEKVNLSQNFQTETKKPTNEQETSSSLTKLNTLVEQAVEANDTQQPSKQESSPTEHLRVSDNKSSFFNQTDDLKNKLEIAPNITNSCMPR
jgi:hypothetical protein